jgi:adenylosuccinate lyase
VLWALAMVGTAIEQIALGVRHWQRTEVGEAEEGFGKGQKGSSAMPHKKNPILSENLCGLARLLRGYAAPGSRTSRCGTSATSRTRRSSA